MTGYGQEKNEAGSRAVAALPDGQRNVLLPDGREERREVHQPVYPVRHHDLLQALEVQDVGEHVGTCGAKELMTSDEV